MNPLGSWQVEAYPGAARPDLTPRLTPAPFLRLSKYEHYAPSRWWRIAPAEMLAEVSWRIGTQR